MLVVGPGLGQGGWGQSLLEQALASDQPLVMDADALNLIAAQSEVYRKQCAAQPDRVRVMTPHPGEAARLLGCSVATLQADRFQSCRELAQRYQAVVLLKGAGTLIDDGQRCWVNEGGNPGMASGGMGMFSAVLSPRCWRRGCLPVKLAVWGLLCTRGQRTMPPVPASGVCWRWI